MTPTYDRIITLALSVALGYRVAVLHMMHVMDGSFENVSWLQWVGLAVLVVYVVLEAIKPGHEWWRRW